MDTSRRHLSTVSSSAVLDQIIIDEMGIRGFDRLGLLFPVDMLLLLSFFFIVLYGEKLKLRKLETVFHGNRTALHHPV